MRMLHKLPEFKGHRNVNGSQEKKEVNQTVPFKFCVSKHQVLGNQLNKTSERPLFKEL